MKHIKAVDDERQVGSLDRTRNTSIPHQLVLIASRIGKATVAVYLKVGRKFDVPWQCSF